jgi:hypothetical protein
MEDTDLIPESHVLLDGDEQTAAELAARAGDSVIVADHIGRRCVPAALARELIERAAQRKHRRAEAERKRNVEHRERFRKIAEKNRPRPGVKLEPGGDMTPAMAMVARDGRPTFTGPQVAALSAGDWLFGAGDTGGLIRPTPAELLEQKATRERNRARRRAGR